MGAKQTVRKSITGENPLRKLILLGIWVVFTCTKLIITLMKLETIQHQVRLHNT
jgi:hypothetical protein